VYSPVSRTEIVEALLHIRDLYRRKRRTSNHEALSHERREAVVRDLVSNLARTGDHPTLKTLLDVAETCRLTFEGAHRLFGYDLRSIREFDFQLNSDRTHIFESYPFERDLPIDLPARLASHSAFSSNAPLRNLVREWHTGVPLRSLEDNNWERPGTFCVRVPITPDLRDVENPDFTRESYRAAVSSCKLPIAVQIAHRHRLRAIVGVTPRRRASLQLSTQSRNPQSGTRLAHKAPEDHVLPRFERGVLMGRVNVTVSFGPENRAMKSQL
jgi:hypothetical protein